MIEHTLAQSSLGLGYTGFSDLWRHHGYLVGQGGRAHPVMFLSTHGGVLHCGSPGKYQATTRSGNVWTSFQIYSVYSVLQLSSSALGGAEQHPHTKLEVQQKYDNKYSRKVELRKLLLLLLSTIILIIFSTSVKSW